jgi:phosphatidate phosphatase APP1
MSGWKRALTRFAHRVELKVDEKRSELGLTGRGTPRIEAYRGYGSADRAFVEARVLRNPPIASPAGGHGALMNLGTMLGRFASREVPGARVRVRHPGGEVVVTADEEGYVRAWFDPRPPFAAGSLWHEVELELVEPAVDPPPCTTAQLLIPPPTAAFGVISDLDDTVVQTGATSLLRMARTVFLSNARTRLPFPGVAAFYRALQHGAGEAPFNPVFYVSSSPWNLHDLLSEFLLLRKIPLGPLLLRDWGLNADEALPTGHASHKLEAIRRILDLFPALPFVLIGDSGQEDPEIYHRVVHDHPDRILAVYIRNVTPRLARTDAIRALADEVEAAGSTLLLGDDTLAAARHAASRGWITADGLAEVEAESRAEHRDAPAGTDEANRTVSTGAR